MREMKTVGGCLCSGVRYEIAGALSELVYCHCEQCRKAQGAVFAANVPVSVAHFSLTSGTELLSSFRSSAEKVRYFCSRCGAGLYSLVDGATRLRIRAGTLDDPPALQPCAHIYVESRVKWLDIDDELPRFIEKEPRDP